LGTDLPFPLESCNEAGSPKATIFAAAAFGTTLLTNNTRLQDAAFTSLQSLILAGGMSYALKYSLGRSRPYHGHDASEFAPYSGNTSFPSGHTTAAFALVTPWVYYYPSPFTYALLGVAGGTAVARVAKQHHWPTDVAAGAALGFLTARFLSKRHMASSSGISIQPVALGDGAQLRFTYRF
jgi:membrane-associated phospholipid phosphatase